MRSQGPIAVVLAVCQLVGFIGLWAVPADALNQAGGGWGVPIALMGSLVVPRIACGLPASRPPVHRGRTVTPVRAAVHPVPD